MPFGSALAVLMRRPTGTISADYAANPVNGTNAYLTHSSALTGLADGKVGTISVWLRVTGSGARRVFTIGNGTSTRLMLSCDASNNLFVRARNASAVDILLVTIGVVSDSDWHHYMISWDLTSTSLRSAWIDGVAATPTWTTYTNDTMDLAAATPVTRIFGNTDAVAIERYSGDIADLWVDDSYVDYTNATVRAKFFLNGSPVDLGATGAIPTGTAPVIFLSGPTASWHTNKGTGGGFTFGTGSLTTGTGPVEVGAAGATPVWASEGAKFEAVVTGTVAVAYPATVGLNDYILMTCLMRADTTPSLTLHADAMAAGFVILASSLSGARRYIVAWKKAAGTEGGTTLNAFVTAGTTNVSVIAKMDRFTAGDGFAATPHESLASIVPTNLTAVAGPTITPTGVNRRGVCLVLVQRTLSVSGAFTGSTPNTWAQAAQQIHSTAPGNLIQTQQIDLSAGTGVSGGSLSLTTSHFQATVAFALVPSGAGGGGPTTQPFTIDRTVIASGDDAEERITNGTVTLASTDIDLGYDPTDVSILKTFLRFTNVTMAPSDTISAAYIQFVAEEVDSSSITMRIWGVAQVSPGAAVATGSYVTNLPKTTAFVDWVIPAWATIGDALAAQRTPDLTPIIDELKALTGWNSGNNVAFVFEKQAGDAQGKRSAYAFDGTAANAATLHIEGTTSVGSGGGGEEPPPPPPDPTGFTGFYKVKHTFNTKIPAGQPTLAPRTSSTVAGQTCTSAEFVADIGAVVDAGTSFVGAFLASKASTDWGWPVRFAKTSDPILTFQASSSKYANPTHWQHYIANGWNRVHWPAGAKPMTGTDKEIGIIDPTRSYITEFFLNNYPTLTTAVIRRWPLNKLPYSQPWDGFNGASMCPIAKTAVVMLYDEVVVQKRIPHALAFAYSYPAHRVVNNNNTMFPCVRILDQKGLNVCSAHAGMRYQYDVDVNPDTECAQVPVQNRNAAKVVLRCLQEYGLFLVDGGGAPGIYMENLDNQGPGETRDWNSAANQASGYAVPLTGYSLLKGLSWSKMRAVEPVQP